MFIKYVICLLLLSCSFVVGINKEEINNKVNMNTENYLYDENQTRYELYQSNGKEKTNWLFFPGGPGADSVYLKSLVDLLNLPGNVWLIDLPGNGSNVGNTLEGYDFDKWFDIFLSSIQRFEDAVLVGHSFGGMFPLAFPELENYLKGIVILSSIPCLWMEEAVSYAKQFNVPDLTKEMTAFTEDPTNKTFRIALDACMPYYFPKNTIEKGRELLADVPFQFLPAVWWQTKAVEMNFSAKWVPQNVPTLIMSGKYDCICPYTLFQKDQRFDRSNITRCLIEDGGHMPWIESPEEVKKFFDAFILELNAANQIQKS